MDYKIITDTSCDLGYDYKDKMNIDFIPFYVDIDGKNFVDDENLDLDEFLNTMVASNDPPNTACPSPENFLRALEETDENNIFVITISSGLSGSYNSAKIAVDEFKESHPEKNVHLVDAKSASAGHSSLVLKAYDILQEDSSFEEKVRKIDEAVNNNRTYFILESLDNSVKTGRIPEFGRRFTNLLNIKLLLKSKDGLAALHQVNRGFKNAMNNLVKQIGKDLDTFNDKTLVISHVDGAEKAEYIKERVEKLYDFKDILILKGRTIAISYADKGGILVGF